MIRLATKVAIYTKALASNLANIIQDLQTMFAYIRE